MGYFTFLQRKDGRKIILRADSELHLKQLRSQECKRLIGEPLKIGPIKNDISNFQFHMGWIVKPKKFIKESTSEKVKS